MKTFLFLVLTTVCGAQQPKVGDSCDRLHTTTISGTTTGKALFYDVIPPDKPCDKYEYTTVGTDHKAYCVPLIHVVTEKEWQELKRQVSQSAAKPLLDPPDGIARVDEARKAEHVDAFSANPNTSLELARQWCAWNRSLDIGLVLYVDDYTVHTSCAALLDAARNLTLDTAEPDDKTTTRALAVRVGALEHALKAWATDGRSELKKEGR